MALSHCTNFVQLDQLSSEPKAKKKRPAYYGIWRLSLMWGERPVSLKCYLFPANVSRKLVVSSYIEKLMQNDRNSFYYFYFILFYFFFFFFAVCFVTWKHTARSKVEMKNYYFDCWIFFFFFCFCFFFAGGQGNCVKGFDLRWEVPIS